MKKYFLLIVLLFIPYIVKANDNLIIESIELEELSPYVEELTPVSIDNNRINLDLKMYAVGDYARIDTLDTPGYFTLKTQ